MNNFIDIMHSLFCLNSILAVIALIAAYNGFSIYVWILLGLVFFVQFDPTVVGLLIYFLISFVLVIPTLRRNILTKHIISVIKKANLFPKISETEKTALRSGNIWVDGQLFSGKPDFKWIFAQKYPVLTVQEQSFLDNEVEEVCRICSDFKTYQDRDLSPEVWQYLKDHKFFGMIIPKQYGGLEFSAYAHSAVVQKLASRSVPLSITVMVPNSLGPAELLLHYGTKAQQDYYLPRLAIGDEIPCFALTEPTAGSDATSIISEGILFKDSDGITKIRLNWNKRYITLGSAATLIGLAFQLRDPENLLKKGNDLGITCALIPHKTQGVIQGRRHDPLATPFVNSPLNGENVIIDIDAVIGGESGLGGGWKMLMECLAAGRGISLPSTSAGGSKLTARVITAYSSIRRQFGAPIGKFEGVEKVLARIVGKTYMLEAMRSFTAGAVDLGLKPAVVTAIAKYHATESFRQVINDGMDIAGGAGIIRGPRNLLANAYFSVPISITVEGANIMTRSLIHFGQGAIMCHPYAYKEIEALEKGDLKSFDKILFAHLGHVFRNKIRAILLSLTRGYLFIPHTCGIIGKYERKIAWASASFAYLADLAMIMYGGNLKRKEKINGRFGDILSTMYMAVCVLKRYEFEGKRKEDEVVVEYIMRDLFGEMQKAFDGIYQNMFGGLLKILILPIAFFSKLNAFLCPATDKLEHDLVKQAVKTGEFRDRLTAGIYVPKEKDEALGRLENAMILFENSKTVMDKIKKAIKAKQIINSDRVEKLITEALNKDIISKSEANLIREAEEAVYDAVQVDEYSLEDYKKAH